MKSHINNFKTTTILLIQHDEETYVEPFLNFVTSKNIIVSRVLLTEKTATAKLQYLKNSKALVIADEPKNPINFEQAKALVVKFFNLNKPIMGLGNVTNLLFSALKINVEYGKKIFGWKPTMTINHPLHEKPFSEYPKRLLFLGNKCFSSDIDLDTYFLNVLDEKFPVFIKHRSLFLLNYTCCLSKKQLHKDCKELDYTPNVFRQTSEEILFQGNKFLNAQNQFTNNIWSNWCNQIN